jgi:hypothetical protein
LVAAFGASMTGGLVTEIVDLVPGTHALVCADSEDTVILGADLVIEAG